MIIIVLYRHFLFTFYHFLCLLLLLAIQALYLGITLLLPKEHALVSPPVMSTETNTLRFNKNIFTSSSSLEDGFSQCTIPGYQLFPHSTVLLRNRLSAEMLFLCRSPVFLPGCRSCFSVPSAAVVALQCVQCAFLSIYPALDLLGLLNVRIVVFIQAQKVLSLAISSATASP